ncbi:MAG: Acetyltransferase (GNAT) family protein [Methanosaeta sp. PtaU1.Bin112]|nr:MAG: Acetyltransferase (GNAT) family protein [Methanosaeta sp. PtaU1.Bin112]
MIFIREEGPKDIEEIRKLNEKTFMQAFGQAPEANLIDSLRKSCANILSLVAIQDDHVVGHIFLSPVKIDGDKAIEGMGLGPIAVQPELQHQGIGSQLVQVGIDMLKTRGDPFIIVLGHPEYYPRFGFERASLYGIGSQWEGVPDEAFMILVLNEEALFGACGVARFRNEFDEAM